MSKAAPSAIAHLIVGLLLAFLLFPSSAQTNGTASEQAIQYALRERKFDIA